MEQWYIFFGGAEGASYRRKISTSIETTKNHDLHVNHSEKVHELERASVEELITLSSDHLLDEIAKKHRLVSYGTIAECTLVLFFFDLYLGTGLTLTKLLIAIASSFPLVLLLDSLDKKRKSIKINYNLDEDLRCSYESLVHSLKQLKKAKCFWCITLEEEIWDRKRNAGAVASLHQERGFIKGSPKFMHMNLDVCQLCFGKTRLCFLPDKVLIYEGKKLQLLVIMI